MTQPLVPVETEAGRKDLPGVQAAAEQAAAVRWLNAYMREYGIVPENDMELALPQTSRALRLRFRFLSASGHHRYYFPLSGMEASRGKPRVLNALELIEWLLDEIAASEGAGAESLMRLASLKDQVVNSMRKTARYLEGRAALANGWKEGHTLLLSERSLLFGHPFHPTPKSSEGFADGDLPKYAPELGAAFPLAYWAVSPDLFKEDWVPDGAGSARLEEWRDWEREMIGRMLPTGGGGFRLLPCHPWQQRHLLGRDDVQGWIEQGKLIALGCREEIWHPTSSVRTVWSPERPFYLKLPLHVRITNFIRTNNEEQRQRTLDAARIWLEAARLFRSDTFGVLTECGSVSLRDPKLAEDSIVLFREAPAALRTTGEQWHVAASLLEDEAGPSPWLPLDAQAAADWVDRYVSVYFIPALSLFAGHGISLEAHVQNTLIRLEDGLPASCLVRDMEGISVCREAALVSGWTGRVIADSSPVLYDREEAWSRFLYYNVTNHWSHMLAAAARSAALDERLLWERTARLLAAAAIEGTPPLREWIGRLLGAPSLPAKANLLSRIRERGERPVYVGIPNPLYRHREEMRKK